MKKTQVFDNAIHVDDRGYFVRSYDCQKFMENNFKVEQVNLSCNPQTHTLRGLHFQTEGPPEDKLITLVSGSVFMAILDLRKDSKNYGEVSEMNFTEPLTKSVYVPAGFATGWITTSPNTTLQYAMSARFEECKYSGIRYDDSQLCINWPSLPKVISKKDLAWSSFKGLSFDK
jgi:dTDP-4-dehydrorhamnose 3,5-epimerase